MLPEIDVVGIDIASLNDVIPKDARLSAEPKLFQHIHSELPWHEEFDRYSQLFSMQQLSASGKSLYAHVSKHCCVESDIRSASERYEKDGLIQYLKRQEEMAKGDYDFQSAMEYNRSEFLQLFSGMNSLSKQRLFYLEELLKTCQNHDCQVAMFVTTDHPELRRVLVSNTRFESLEIQSRTVLGELATKWNARFVDFGTIESYAGDPTEFIDGIHPLESNTRRMIDLLFPTNLESLYAVQ